MSRLAALLIRASSTFCNLQSAICNLKSGSPNHSAFRTSHPSFAARTPRLERLEDRLALSGFGPEDGACIVEPWMGDYSDVKIQPGDQKIVAAGTVYGDNISGVNVARYDAGGNPDPTYGVGGVARPQFATTSEGGQDLVLLPDGKAVVAGVGASSSSPQIFGVGRLNANGTPDSTFGNAGWTALNVQTGSPQAAYAVGLQSTGKIVTDGVNAVARFTTNGSVDSGKNGFGSVAKGKALGYTLTGTNTYFEDLAVQADDKIVAVGSVRTNEAPSTYAIVVARYTASGSSDTTFNGNGQVVLLPGGMSIATARCVALQADGKIVIAGYSSGVDGYIDMFVARFNTNGSLDPTFGGGAGYVRVDIDGTATLTREMARDIAIQPDGKIVLAGYENLNTGGPANVMVARLNTDGTLDQTFGTGGFKWGASPDASYHSFDARAVALEADGSIIVAGADYRGRSTADGINPFLLRFSGASTAPSGASASASAATDAALLSLLSDDAVALKKRR